MVGSRMVSNLRCEWLDGWRFGQRQALGSLQAWECRNHQEAETIREAAIGQKGTSGMMVVHRETSRDSRRSNGWGGGGIGGRRSGGFRSG